MSIGLLLTIIFIVAQALGFIDWAWWQIALPLLIELGFTLVALVIHLILVATLGRPAIQRLRRGIR